MAPIDASGALRNWRPSIVLKRLVGRGWWEQRLTLVTILGPHPNFLLFSTILFRALGHSFLTRSLTRRSDRHQVT